MNKNEMIKDLSKPFPAEAIDWRVGATNADKSKGIALAYLQARPVMDRLDEVVGPENWQDAYTPIQGPNGLSGFICTLSLKIGDEWVNKTDGSDTSDVEPIKGGFSDSFKRAAVKWGIGRYLYDLPNTWYPIEPKGRSHVLKATPTLPAWALPSGNLVKAVVKQSDTQPAEGNRLSIVTGPDYDLTTLDLSAALKTVDSDGKPFGEFDNKTLSYMATEYNKRLKLKDGTDVEAKYKLEAAKMIMKERANGSIK